MIGKKLVRTLVVTLCLLLPFAGQAQDSLEGEWWITIKGRTKGAAKFVFSELFGEGAKPGEFRVTGRGTTLSLGEFFVVSDDQFLQRASNRRISGTIAIEDAAGDPLGTFEFDNGRVNKTFTKLNLRGDLKNSTTVRVKFVGKRFLSQNPVLSGLTQDGRVGGRGLKSRSYELLVDEDETADAPFQGFPFFDYVGIGPVQVDGVEEDRIFVFGSLVIDSKFKAFGTFFSDDFGDGTASGSLREGKTANVPRVRLTARAARTVKSKGNLNRAVSPRLQVSPADTLDFESVDTDDTKTLSFSATNTGIGTLAGTATVDDIGSPFTIVSGSPYNLGEGQSTQIEVTFAPTSTGNFTSGVTFTDGGGANRKVTGIGTDPDGTISVEPAAALIFGDVALGTLVIQSFTVTNTGGGQLDGAATLVGFNEFRLVNDLDQPVNEITYSLATNESTTVRVRFAPVVPGSFNAVVTFIGGNGAVRDVNGNGVIP